jgi:hypothetical protein
VDDHGNVIVVVEGPSAAGKTTWCLSHAERFVAEYVPTGDEPKGTHHETQADYWVSVNSRRWSQALELERRTGLAICDSDPLKLHYSWCLSMTGAAPRSRWEFELDVTRRAFEVRALGLADLVLIGTPPLERLLQQRAGDLTRRRRHFELHARQRDEPWFGPMSSTGDTKSDSPGRGLGTGEAPAVVAIFGQGVGPIH